MTTRKVNTRPRKTDDSSAPSGPARYRRLPTGAHGLTREEVERDQRERLRSAMVELIASRGYPAVRILDLTQLAHVSRPTFYNLYSDKEELLLSAYEDIAGRTTERAAEAFAEGESEQESLRLSLQAFAELAAAEPEAMTLALLGTFGAGPRALERRNRTLQSLEQIILAGRGRSGGEQSRDLTVKFLIGGVREVAATRLRRGRAQELVGAGRRSQPLGELVSADAAARARGAASRAPARGGGPGRRLAGRARRRAAGARRDVCRADATTCHARTSSKASANGSSTRPRRSSPRRGSPA